MDKKLVSSKKERLINRLKEAGSVLLAYSGGVDSTFLLTVARETLGGHVVAATALSDIYPQREAQEAKVFTSERDIEHLFFKSGEMTLPDFLSNGPDRCYHCKKLLFRRLIKIAEDKRIKHVAHGANADDLKDYRPGLRAAREMGILSPLIDAGLEKQEIRFLAKELGLAQWDKPPMACLASRIPYGNPITPEKLKMIDKAEAFLIEKGIRQCRVRHHGSVARIELDAAGREMIMDPSVRKAVVRKFRDIGFLHVALDLEGFVSGSLNRELDEESNK